MFHIDICAKQMSIWNIACSHYVFIGWLSHHEAKGTVVMWQAKSVSAVWVCISAFVRVKPVNILKETLGQFPGEFCILESKPGYLWQEVEASLAVSAATRPGVLSHLDEDDNYWTTQMFPAKWHDGIKRKEKESQTCQPSRQSKCLLSTFP